MMVSKSYLLGRGAAVLLIAFAAACGTSSGGSTPTPTPAGPPTVTSSTPLTDAVDVPLDGNASVTFSKAMDPATLTASTFTLTSGAAAVPVQGRVTYSDSTAVFTPDSDLDSDGSFTATVTTGAKCATGEGLESNRSWRFHTGRKHAVPAVLATTPTAGATGVLPGDGISATFSTAMDPATLTIATFTLTSGAAAVPVTGSVSYANAKAVFTPAAPLVAGGAYTATITTGAKSAFGVVMAASRTWSFTTATALPTRLPVALGTAGNFAILAKSGISTVPTSAVTGDMGVSPAAATYVTGFDLIADATNTFWTSTQVVGKVYAADDAQPTPANLTTAVGDMELAFTDAAGRAPDVTELGAGNIGGLTIVPGVYKWGTGVLVPTDVTLSGSATDVWIFEIPQDLTVSSAAKVVLAGGALPKNVFWQVSGKVVLGTTAHLEGIVLTQTAVTLATGASVNGRLLAQTAVTLDASTVIAPAP